MTMRKFLHGFFAFLLGLSIIAVPVFAEDDDTSSDDTATEDTSGEQTEEEGGIQMGGESTEDVTVVDAERTMVMTMDIGQPSRWIKATIPAGKLVRVELTNIKGYDALRSKGLKVRVKNTSPSGKPYVFTVVHPDGRAHSVKRSTSYYLKISAPPSENPAFVIDNTHGKVDKPMSVAVYL
jgi:hypothetical protein